MNLVNYNQSIAESIVFVGFFVFVIGAILVLYWQHIIMGAIGVACLFVLMNHKVDATNVEQQTNGITVPSEHDAYINKCMNSTEYTKEQCEMAWKDMGIEKVKSL
jgi:uncharacterized membrane protein